MKRKKVCALLCITAISTATVTPVMATEGNTAQVQNEANQEQRNVTDGAENDEVSENAGIGNEETTDHTDPEEAIENSEQADENQDSVQGQKDQHTIIEEVPEQSETQSADEEEKNIPKEGWYVDQNGNTYYYEYGVALENTIKEIASEDGVKAFYFDYNGIMLKDTWRQIAYLKDGTWVSGWIRADENGCLQHGWFNGDDEYYGEDFFRYNDKFLEEDGKLYYFNGDGLQIKNTEIIIEGKRYKADENGILTLVDTSKENGWRLAGNNWYYYENGALIKDSFKEINGVRYHFEKDGKMSTGAFYPDPMSPICYLAEPNGEVVNGKHGWYHSSQTDKWYWFNGADSLILNSFVKDAGKKYYVGYDGAMQTGVFWISTYDEDKKEYVSKQIYADGSGIINEQQGWKKDSAGNLYYVKKDGSAAINEIVEIGSEKYYLDYNGQMETGKINIYDSESGDYNYYVTDSNGAFIKDNWVRTDLEWYYAGKDGKLYRNQWAKRYYFMDDGSMAVGAAEIDGKTYVFDENGKKEGIVGEKDGWQLYDGNWYYTKDGEAYDGWLDGTYYISDGKMATNIEVPAENAEDRYCYVGADGKVQKGWRYDSGLHEWQYADKDEKTKEYLLAKQEWKQINGTWYYFDEYSIMVSNTIKNINEKLYEFANSGAWIPRDLSAQGWKQSETGAWYYVNADGSLNTKEKKKIGNLTYYFYNDGEMISNSLYSEYSSDGFKYYWINSNGNIDEGTGWRQTKWGSWYYLENGNIVTGNKKVNGSEYYFNPSMYIGMREDNGRYYLYDDSGTRQVWTNGWYQAIVYGETCWYNFVSGKPASGWLNGYYFGYNGYMTSGYVSTMSGIYMFDKDGHLRTNGWICENGTWYYAGKTGRLYTGERKIGGVTYLFDDMGRWVR